MLMKEIVNLLESDFELRWQLCAIATIPHGTLIPRSIKPAAGELEPFDVFFCGIDSTMDVGFRGSQSL